MIPPDRYQDARYLRRNQYREAGNLEARAALHGRFSANPVDWFVWVCERLELAPGMRVLECGCGTGVQWRQTAACLPPRLDLTLTDISAGMLTTARANLAGVDQPAVFAAADIQSLPFGDDQFDLVLANHMLYHVADRPRAFAEVCRVLRPGGRFVAATNGLNHMRELFELPAALGLEPPAASQPHSAFSLENGREQLESWFADVTLEPYPDHLEITAVEPLLAYALSSSEARAFLTPALQQQLRDHVTAVVAAEGAFRIQKATGLFTAVHPRKTWSGA